MKEPIELEILDRLNLPDDLRKKVYKKLGISEGYDYEILKNALMELENYRRKAKCWDLVREHLYFEFHSNDYNYIVLKDTDQVSDDECTWIRFLSQEEFDLIQSQYQKDESE